MGQIVCVLIEKPSKKSIDYAKSRANKILNEAHSEAENIKNNKILQAKEKFLELKSEHEKYILSKNAEHNDKNQYLKLKETEVKQKLKKIEKLKAEFEEKIKSFNKKNETVEKKKLEINKVLRNQVKEIEKIAGYSAKQAKDELFKILKDEVKSQALEISQNIIDEAKLSAKQEAKKIVISSIQRLGTEEAIDNCVSVFNIESDDIKGRIIGREGIKLVTRTDKRNSQGGEVMALGGIDLIAGNDDSDLQPIPKGDNLVECLSRIIHHLNKLNGIVDNLLMIQMSFNEKLTNHFHISPFFGLPTAPSETVMTQGAKTMLDHSTQTKVSLASHKANLTMMENNYLNVAGAGYINSRHNNTN